MAEHFYNLRVAEVGQDQPLQHRLVMQFGAWPQLALRDPPVGVGAQRDAVRPFDRTPGTEFDLAALDVEPTNRVILDGVGSRRFVAIPVRSGVGGLPSA